MFFIVLVDVRELHIARVLAAIGAHILHLVVSFSQVHLVDVHFFIVLSLDLCQLHVEETTVGIYLVLNGQPRNLYRLVSRLLRLRDA